VVRQVTAKTRYARALAAVMRRGTPLIYSATEDKVPGPCRPACWRSTDGQASPGSPGCRGPRPRRFHGLQFTPFLRFVNHAQLTLVSHNIPNLTFGAPLRRDPTARKRIGMRVLLIEDDFSIAQSIELILKSESFNVYSTDLGGEGVDLGKLYDYDIILLDLNLPDMSGFEVLRSLRLSKINTPILILSGITGVEHKVKCLGFGADDYLTKPFHKTELIARIQAIVRRSRGHAQSVVQIGDLTINVDAKTVHVDTVQVHLTGREYQMLELLSLRRGTTITKEVFLNHLYGGMDEPEIKIIDVFICKIRKKLAGASNGKDYIETLWGRGYLLREPAEAEAKIPA
jgi:two-component system, cell cycle response regulator CtrA